MARIRNKPALKNIAKTIKQIRREKGLTQEDFLFDCNIHIGRLEMGIYDFSFSTLMAVCDKLGILPSELLKEFEKMPGSFDAFLISQNKFLNNNHENNKPEKVF